MGGERKALIVANDEYDHAALRRLKAPAADARALARALGDHDIGGFQVEVALNEPAHDVELRIEDLFAESKTDDILLLHFSCHGLKSEAGELFFAARNTRPDRLGATAIPADFIQRCIKACRARSVVLFLDCCYGGAYGQGVTVRASGSANVLESFPAGKLGGGKGRAVITASSSMEYAFEGNELADNKQQQPSVFTSALVEGLETGEADRDEDGLISLNELYEYVFDKVQERNPNQTPSRDVEMQGELYVARSRRKRIRPVPIPVEVQVALKDPNMFTRLGGVSELRARLNSEDVAAALGAHAALTDLERTDIKYVGDAASEALAGTVLRVVESELSFGEVEQDSAPEPLTLHLTGPPIARTCTFSTTDRWIQVEDASGSARVTLDTSAVGLLRGSILVKGPTGETTVPVTVAVVAAEVSEAVDEVVADEVKAPPEPVARPAAPVDAKTEPVPMPSADVETKPEPVPLPTTQDETRPEPVQMPSARVEARLDALETNVVGVGTSPEPTQRASAAAAIPSRPAAATRRRDDASPPAAPRTLAFAETGSGSGSRLLRVAAQIAVVAGAMMALSPVLPFRYDASMTEKAPYVGWYLFLAGGLAVAGGVWTVASPSRSWTGTGLVLGAAALPTWGLPHLIGAWVEGDADGFNYGYQVALLGQLLLLACGGLVIVALARMDEVSLAGLSLQDRLGWLVVVVAAASALIMFAEGTAGWQNSTWYGVQTVLAAVLAIVLPSTAVLVRPRRLGISMLAGWLIGALALTISYWSWLAYRGYETPKINLFFVSVLVLAAAAAAWAAKAVRRPEAQSQGG